MITDLSPAPPAASEPSEPNRDMDLYARSFLAVRAAIGVIGIGLPLLLMAGDGLFLKGGEVPRGSLSAYYHTGMRDVFVGCLCAVALFLVTYMIVHRGWDNRFSTVAGLAAFGVALFPTAGQSPLTPLQDALGEATVSRIHFGCAAVFILSLAIISFRFGQREKTGDNCAKQPRLGLKWLHRACAGVILAAVVYMLANALHRFDAHAVFWGETSAAWAFGVSWLVKGELKILFGRKRVAPAPAAGARLALETI